MNRTIAPSLSSLSLDTPRVHLLCNDTITPTLIFMKILNKVKDYLLSLGIGLMIGEVV
tara:strand:- start:97 stop:270 length:174 start_codon:yes stop_codon:yes gene_type:complete